MVGDLFAHGSDVGDIETWPAALERILGQPVVNAGLGGYGTDQIILSAEYFMPIFTPKTLIISFMDDDIRRAGYSIFGGGSKPYFTIENGALVLQNVPVPEKLTVDRRQLSVLDNIIGGSYLLEWLTLRIGLPQWYEVSVHQPVQNDPVRDRLPSARAHQARDRPARHRELVRHAMGQLADPHAQATAGRGRGPRLRTPTRVARPRHLGRARGRPCERAGTFQIAVPCARWPHVGCGQ